MKRSALIAYLIAASAAVQPAVGEETCEDRLNEISTAWAEKKKQLLQESDVTVSTGQGDVTVTALNAKPTENWFGNPPDAVTVDKYLESAEAAARQGDIEGCLEHLGNVEEAMAYSGKGLVDK